MKLVGINALGDDPTEYVSNKKGDEHCSNCEHYVASEKGCNGPKMRKLSDRPRLPDGNVKVTPGAWCKFWEE